MASVKVFSFALLLVLLFSVDVEGYVLESTSLCCNTHPEFGRCIPNLDTRRCNSWCLKGCDNKKVVSANVLAEDNAIVIVKNHKTIIT
ncbi:hypothetical protein Bca52824_050689 [Brassica carinata]|uniref:Uncharacterized protein n=1 Tax=Brassica carinata TaxID=52824 RepID=A0A8X7QYX9_BRACI|nr:hypothetical protein Bca52824_050689 [Brassica carinata]